MKIAHINLSDSSGGAAIAALRLHRGMLEQGIDSKMFVVRRALNSDDNTIQSPSWIESSVMSNARYAMQRARTRKCDRSRGLYSYDIGSSTIVNPKNFVEFDAIYLHWINHGMLSLSALHKLLMLNRPVIWVCHDFWAVTGGCHHPLDCNKHLNHCGQCPSLVSNNLKDYSYKLFGRKDKLYQKFQNLHFVAISPFMESALKSSPLSKDHYIYPIANALDVSIFYPKNRADCRKELGLPNDKLLLLYGADMGVKNPYKGWLFAKELIERVCKKHPELFEIVVFGSDRDAAIELPAKVHYMGRIADPNKMATLYSAANIYLNPSMAETLSYTTMEAVACGAATVAFGVGGIPSIVDSEMNGFLADFGDVDALERGIEWAMKHQNDEFRAACHRTVTCKFETKLIVDKHIALLSNAISCGI